MAISYRSDVTAAFAAIAHRREPGLLDLAQRDPAAFARTYERLRAWRDSPGLLAAGLVEQKLGRLTGKGRITLAHSLLEAGRYAEALDTLGAGGHANARLEAAHWHARSLALAGMGSFHKAAVAAGTGNYAALEAQWGRLAQLQVKIGSGLTWAEAAELGQAAFSAGARKVAREAIRASVDQAASAPPEALEHLRAIAPIAFDTLDTAAAGLVDRLRVLAPDDVGILALETEAWVRQARYEEIWAREDLRRSHDPVVHRLRAEALRLWGREHAAVKILSVIAKKHLRDNEARGALARTVGQSVLKETKLRFASRETRKILNLVPFNNEFELLHLRMREMYPWVDRFVIVEARSTFTGQPKPAWFEQRKAEFEPWMDKISHVVIDEFPHQTSTAWARDFWQRDMAIRGVNGMWAPQDIVLLTDADEIVRREAIEGFDDGVLALKMQTYRYFLNYGAEPGSIKADGHTGAICTAQHLARYGSSYVRFFQSRPNKYAHAVPNAGWHFTSLGDAERISGKFAAYAHQEKKALGSQSRVQRELTAILNGEYDAGWAPAPVDASFPAYVRENQEALRDLLLPVEA